MTCLNCVQIIWLSIGGGAGEEEDDEEHNLPFTLCMRNMRPTVEGDLFTVGLDRFMALGRRGGGCNPLKPPSTSTKPWRPIVNSAQESKFLVRSRAYRPAEVVSRAIYILRACVEARARRWGEGGENTNRFLCVGGI